MASKRADSRSTMSVEALAELRSAAMTGDTAEVLPKVELALRKFPDDPAVQKYAGVVRYRRKEFAVAESLLAKAVANAVEDVEALTFLMRAHYNAGNESRCEHVARALLALAPHNLDALRTLGRTYNRRSDWQQAAEVWQALAEASPTDAESPLQAARSHRRLGNTEAALSMAGKALELDSANDEALRIKTESALILHRYDILLDVIARYFDLNPDRTIALLQRLAQGDEISTAASMLATLRTERPSASEVQRISATLSENWSTRAIRSELQRDDRNAAIYLCALRTLHPEDETITESLARLKGYFTTAMRDAANAGDGETAAAAAELVLMVEPTAHEAWYTIGRKQLVENNSKSAVEPLCRATESAPENAWYWLNYARALRRSGNAIDAIPAFRRVIELSKERQQVAEAEEALSRLPSALLASVRNALGEGRPMEALAVHDFLATEAPSNPYLTGLLDASMQTLLTAARQAFKSQSPATRLLAERYLAYEPGNAEVELILARTLMREKAYEEALPLWEKLSDATPGEAHYHLQIARCHARQGRGAAVAAARRVLDLDSSIAEANSIIKQFEPRTDCR